MTDELVEKAKLAYRFLLSIRSHRDQAGIHFKGEGLRIEIGVGHLYHQDLVVQVVRPGEMIDKDLSKRLQKILDGENDGS